MTVSAEQDIGPLIWVKSEIDLALGRASDALVSFSLNSDKAQIKFAQTHLHQAQGALAIVGLDGLTQFAQSLERLLAACEQGTVAASRDTVELGRRAIGAIRQYLDDLAEGQKDQPLKLLPLYEELQKAIGNADVQASDLFFPDLTLRPPRRQSEMPAPSGPALAKLYRTERQRFERGLLQFLKSGSAGPGLKDMRAAIAAIESVQNLSAARAFWWSTLGFLDVVAASQWHQDKQVKRLCGRIDHQFRRLIEGTTQVPERLMRDVLYYVAMGGADSEQARLVCDTYQLQPLVAVPAPAKAVNVPQQTVLREVRDAVTAVKESWDRFCAGAAIHLPHFDEDTVTLDTRVTRLAHPLLKGLSSALRDVAQWLRKDPLRQNESVAMEVATTLLLLENAVENFEKLDSSFTQQAEMMISRLHAVQAGQELGVMEVPLLGEMSRRAQERLLMRQVVREIQTNLHQIEQTLDGFFRDPAKRAELVSLNTPIKQVEGALFILGQGAAATVLQECSAGIARFSAGEGGTEDYETVASKLSALGFFVESLPYGKADIDRLLGREPAPVVEEIEVAPVELPEPVAPAPAKPSTPAVQKTQAPAVAAEPEGELRLEDTVIGDWRDREYEQDQVQTVVASAGFAALMDAELDLSLDEPDITLDLEPQLEAPAPTPAPVAAPATPVAAKEAPTKEESFAPEPVANTLVAQPSAQAARLAEASAEVIDAELLSIFLEEAHEVLGNISGGLEVSRNEPHNQAVLTTIRRGFHTLKGSGRMVNLKDLGEAAWAIEQVMNRWLQGEDDATPDLHTLLGEANALFERWVQQLEAGGSVWMDASELVARAERVKAGQPIGGQIATVTVADAEEAILAEEPAFDAQEIIAVEALPEPMADLADAAMETIDLGDLDDGLPDNIEPLDLEIAPLADEAQAVSAMLAEAAVAQPGLDSLGDFSLEPVLAAEVVTDLPLIEETVEIQSLEGEGAFELEEIPAPELPSLLEPAPAVETHASALDFDFSLDAAPALESPTQPVADLSLIEALPLIDELPTAPSSLDGPIITEGELLQLEPELPPAIDWAHASNAETPIGLLPDVNDALADDLEWGPMELEGLGSDANEVTVHAETVSERAVPSSQAAAIKLPPLASVEPLESLESEEAIKILELPEPDLPEPTAAELALPQAPVVEALHTLAEVPAAPELPQPLVAAEPEVVVPEPIELGPVVLSEPEPEPVIDPDTIVIGHLRISRGLFQVYMEEAVGHVGKLCSEFSRLAEHPGYPPVTPVQRAAHTLAGISGTVGLESLQELARGVEHALARLATDNVGPDAEQAKTLDEAAHMLHGMVLAVGEQKLPPFANELTARVEAIRPHAPDEEIHTEPSPLELMRDEVPPVPAAPPVSPVPDALAEAIPDVEQRTVAIPEPVRPASFAAPAVPDEIDQQLLPIFLEEAQDLVRDIDNTAQQWRQNPEALDPSKALARQLHTLKGSARMAGAMGLGELVHNLETRVDHAATHHAATPQFFEEVDVTFDLVHQIIEWLKDGAEGPMPGSVVSTPVEPIVAPQAEAPASVVPAVETASAPVQPSPAASQATVAGDAEHSQLLDLAESEAQQQRASLRVRADLVDRLVNEAGEMSISRARIEGEMRTLHQSLLDLTENVIRLRKQLREIEIQAETQMQSRQAQAEVAHAGFDPLEFDRFTRFQELTRMMAESVNDVSTVQHNLLKNLEGADAALMSQARINRELAQSLMSVRMVPFDSLTSRLYRIVRQTAKELGKKANLDIRGGQVELDRSVLEKMSAPLEHLLRNALTHGIEAPGDRMEAGKSEVGQITLTVSQEGNEVVIDLADDGKGLDFQRIRDKAVQRGLIEPGAPMDEKALTQFIFHAGFSTAAQLSEVAGRGVGMDVVRNQTAALGGRIDIASTQGKGAGFRIYLPLTLAVTQAVLVSISGRTFAIPSSMVEQVQELKPAVLTKIVEAGEAQWLGNHYPYHFLPRLLGDKVTQPQTEHNPWILLLRSGSQRVAIEVDDLRGTQEIVVKNTGPQLARVVGVAGATVLGDGEVVLILNPVALAARAQTIKLVSAKVAEAMQEEPAAPLVPTIPTIMVVDDSLTVRKIASRLLEREGYRVVAAKDGVDALEQLLEIVPQAMMVDIEMPRMDGFDLTRNIRADARLKHIPIIMITSRMADKHRAYAKEIGVNNYLGKPYQEDELLDLLAHYTGRQRPDRAA